MMDALTLVRQMDPNDPRAVRFMVRRDQFEKLRDAVERQQVRILRLESVMRDMKKISQSGSICAADVMEDEIDEVLAESEEQSAAALKAEALAALESIYKIAAGDYSCAGDALNQIEREARDAIALLTKGRLD